MTAIPYAFLDRDGTLIREPADGRVDQLGQVDLMPGVISALQRISAAGYRLVIVSNQDGLGGPDWPRADFDATHAFIERLFASQGIEFDAAFFCRHMPDEDCGCRKPLPGLVLPLLATQPMDVARSFVVGDRQIDLELADALGIRGYRLAEEPGGTVWDDVAHAILENPRRARQSRRTNETDITVELDLDREGPPVIDTGIGFFDHMLEQIAKHAGIELRLTCAGDLEVDEHHTVEDCALTLGAALREALGDKRGIGRYGFVLPMDEARATVSIDLSGRALFQFQGEFGREVVGGLPTELVPHFFRSLTDAIGAALHIEVTGDNAHHMIEACFKGTGRVLRQAIAREGRSMPSTKGMLE